MSDEVREYLAQAQEEIKNLKAKLAEVEAALDRARAHAAAPSLASRVLEAALSVQGVELQEHPAGDTRETDAPRAGEAACRENIASHLLEEHRLREQAEARLAEVEKLLPRCAGKWIGGSGGHRVYDPCCTKPGVWDVGAYGCVCDEHKEKGDEGDAWEWWTEREKLEVRLSEVEESRRDLKLNLDTIGECAKEQYNELKAEADVERIRAEKAETKLVEVAAEANVMRLLLAAAMRDRLFPWGGFAEQVQAALSHDTAARAALDELEALKGLEAVCRRGDDSYIPEALACIDAARNQTRIIECDIRGCRGRITHAEHWYNRIRYWCNAHVPMSGHYEYCPDPCEKLVASIDEARKVKP